MYRSTTFARLSAFKKSVLQVSTQSIEHENKNKRKSSVLRNSSSFW